MPQRFERCLHVVALLLATWLAGGLSVRADVPPLKKRSSLTLQATKPGGTKTARPANSEAASILKPPKLLPAQTETAGEADTDDDAAVGQVSNLSGIEERPSDQPALRDGTRSVPATLKPAASQGAGAEHGILRRNRGGPAGVLTPTSAVRATAATSSAPPLLHLPPIHGQRRADWADDPVEGDKPLHSLTTNVLPNKGEMPANYAAARFAKAGEDCHHVGTSRPWVEMVYDWEAAGFCHGPLYFEEDYIERYGHSWGPAQPFVSGAHFFARIPIIPYMATAYPPHECIYTLGHERPGNYVPYHYVRLPLRASAAAVQAGVVVGLVYLIP